MRPPRELPHGLPHELPHDLSRRDADSPTAPLAAVTVGAVVLAVAVTAVTAGSAVVLAVVLAVSAAGRVAENETRCQWHGPNGR